MVSKCFSGETGKGVASEKEDILEYVATYMGKLMDVIENMEKDLRVLIDKNDEMDDDCEDDYVGKRDNYSKEDKGEDNDIPDCNQVDSSTNHATTIVLKDVEYDDPIYDNPSVGDNVACKNKACKFDMRATKLPKRDYWQVLTFHKDVYNHLMKLRLERWAHARSPVRLYKLMTSNIAECINSCLKQARKMPITVLIECIRAMFQCWFHDLHKKVLNLTMPLNP
ncbi:Uncharacterized protein TCM_024147 [Theobroma cacao]|uniref:Uncharacterized protein n=1 Tax=Theobroma cacao TaxID=3641 RepID=A0A061EWR6_THECC|nr:Uncharacterized protein TCM_024147 [Theobroma cacao]